jgi:hypothetical protein
MNPNAINPPRMTRFNVVFFIIVILRKYNNKDLKVYYCKKNNNI